MTTSTHYQHPLISAIAEFARQGDRRRLAILRRSLARDPGEDWQVIGVIEPILVRLSQSPESPRRNHCAYLVAGLMALFNEPSSIASGVSLGAAMHQLHARPGAKMTIEAVERRLMQLVDADDEQLPTRLRSVMQLLRAADIAPDFHVLLRDLFNWNDESRRVQRSWLRDFYWRKDDDSTVETPVNSDPDLNRNAA